MDFSFLLSDATLEGAVKRYENFFPRDFLE